ncbi:MAG: hypothetical protein KJ698_03735 [Actinobacteria bacterium]|nr:hypothetical protein [Actinomycetota bacterium]MBU1492589.1 hypothetical protein [Actinomycetota bacterium]
MATSRIVIFGAHPATVFEALLDAAGTLDARVDIIDAKARQAVVSREGKSYRVAASVTDNGWGESTLCLSWTPPGSTAAGKCAKRLITATREVLEGMEAPPPPAPPP